MTDLFATKTGILPSRKIGGRVSGLFEALAGDFVTTPASSLELTFDGIVGDYHAGATRKSGGREPWYPRGTEMRNERQLSILASDELRKSPTAWGWRNSGRNGSVAIWLSTVFHRCRCCHHAPCCSSKAA